MCVCVYVCVIIMPPDAQEREGGGEGEREMLYLGGRKKYYYNIFHDTVL